MAKNFEHLETLPLDDVWGIKNVYIEDYLSAKDEVAELEAKLADATRRRDGILSDINAIGEIIAHRDGTIQP